MCRPISPRSCGSRAGRCATAALMIFPELGLSAYAIDDLLFQDALLGAVERAVDELAEASRGLYPVLVVGAPLRCEGRALQLRGRDPSRRGARRRAEDLSAELPRVLRTPPLRLRGGHAGRRDHGRRPRSALRRRPPVPVRRLGARSPSTSRSARTSGCRCRPPRWRRLAGAEVLLNLSASNITIGKAETRRLLCASQSARAHRGLCLFRGGPRRIDHRPRLGRPCRRLRMRRPARRDGALSAQTPDHHRRCRPRPHSPGAHARQHFRRLRPRGSGARRPSSARSPSSCTRRRAPSRCGARSSAFRSCPPIR